MALDRFFPLSDFDKILTIRRFHCASRFAARKKLNFKLLTYHYIARATLQLMHESRLTHINDGQEGHA